MKKFITTLLIILFITSLSFAKPNKNNNGNNGNAYGNNGHGNGHGNNGNGNGNGGSNQDHSTINKDSSNIIIKGMVENTPYCLNLIYGNDINTGELVGNETYIITDSNNQEFNLQEDGQTKYFFVTLNGNSNTSTTVTTQITAGNFLPVNIETPQNNFVKVKINSIENHNGNIDPGYKDNYLIKKFNLYWSGKNNLAAGEYQSKVVIHYTAT